MKKRPLIILSSAILAVASIGTVTGVLLSKNHETKQTLANYIWDYPFECDDWFYSGKGFKMEFSFDTTLITDGSKINVELIAKSKSDERLTNKTAITFYTDGRVTSQRGNVIKNENGTFTYTAMFSEFDNWNTSDANVVNGHECACKISFRDCDFVIEKVHTCLIDSRMNVYPYASIRDEEDDNLHGLMFKSYIPNVKSEAKYGMAIVPNEYIGRLTSDYCSTFSLNGKSFVESYCNPLPITSSDPLYERYGGGYYIKCSMADIKETNYMRDFSAVPFEEISGVRTYAWNTNEEKDNLYDVCTRALTSGASLSESATTYYNSILNNIKNRTAALSSEKLTTYVVNSSDQYLKNASVTSLGNKISIKAAKGETENAQIVLVSTSSQNLEFYASVSNLENGNNIINNDNIETDVELYTNITTTWSASSSHVNHLSHLYPNGAETLTLGWWPDALLPMDIAVRSGRNSLSITNGANQGLFFRIKVPENVPAGLYTGNVIVYAKGQNLITVPLELTVLDFSMANRRDANTAIIFNLSETSYLYDIPYNSVITSNEYKKGLNFLAERGISGGLIPCKARTVDDLPEYIETLKNYLKNEKTDTYFLDFNQDTVSMRWKYRTGTISTSTIDVEEDVFCCDDSSDSYGNKIGLKTLLTALVNASTSELDLLKGATIYDPHADEPNVGNKYVRNILNYNSLRKSIDYVKETADFTGKLNVKDSLDKIFYICTAGPEVCFTGSKAKTAYADVTAISNVSGANNCGCATLNDITYKRQLDFTPNMMWDWNSGETNGAGQCWTGMEGIYNGTNPNNYRAWEYTCVQPVSPYPSYTLNTPTIRMRANYWREFNLNFQGFLFYMANRTTFYENDVSNPLTEEEILNGGVIYEGAPADGLLVYPVHNMFGYADRELYYLSSLRLENTSEANDDFNYLAYAKELILEQASPSSYLTRLANICNTLSVDNCPAKVTNDASLVNTARNNLISLINELTA